ncbi:uncharacterized protein A4U43_C09F3580 [Asparagus officinalis]|uniref:Replication protein A OB domain-containing protein n=1 Tax=Asparagus officinalis TaxID=4686 RepID=A0A5P1E5J9_ASPOF|nr:uncharacterized protein A4U43_C09F3580 [Asparagus officinalis]
MYTITNGEVKPPNLKYTTTNLDKELALTTKSIMRETKNFVSLEKLKPTFLSFKDASAFDDGKMSFNVFGFVITIKPIFSNHTSKRMEVIIMNKEFDQLSMTLWGDLAEIEGSYMEVLKDAKPVVALLSVIGEFQLSTKQSTLVLMNPEIPQCREMKDCCGSFISFISKF